MKKISFILPCYNEEEVLPILYERLNKVSKQLNNYECEFLFINDGSKDRTEEIIKNFHKEDKRVTLYSFSRNFGQWAAISCGIHNCNSDLAVIMDSDLQDPPEIISDMIRMYEETKTSIIYGKRLSRKDPIIKKILIYFFYRIVNFLSGQNFPLDAGQFRLIDKKVIETYKNFSEIPKYVPGIISWMGFNEKAFEYDRQGREIGKTKYSYIRLIKLGLKAILSFSVKPLKISLFFGLISILIATILLIKTFYFYFFVPERIVPGYSSTIIILFIGGVQLISLSVISEYLANMFNEVKK